MEILGRMFSLSRGEALSMPNQRLWISIAVLLVGQWLLLRGYWNKYSQRIPAPLMGMGYAVLLSLALLLKPDTGKLFKYFEF